MIHDIQYLSIPLRLNNNIQMPYYKSGTDFYTHLMLPRKDAMDFCKIEDSYFNIVRYEATGDLN
jgi:hypothetical protein